MSNMLTARKIKTLAYGACFLTVLYYFGVFTHLFESEFKHHFRYPYDGDIEELVQQLRSNATPKVPPINTYNFRFAKSSSNKCKNVENLRLVFLVKSAPEHFDRRLAIRSSWGFEHRFSDVEIRTVFLLEVDFWETPLRETELFYSKPYQKGIEKKLKFCIQRLQVLINAYIVKTKEIGTLIALFAICGVLMGIGFSLYLFSGKFTPEYYLRLTFMTLVAVTTFSSIIWGGQSTETIITEMITALCQVRWYNFSQTNKKLYLILLTNMMKDRKIKFTENYSINYQLGLAIVRGIYSIMSVVVKMRS